MSSWHSVLFRFWQINSCYLNLLPICPQTADKWLTEILLLCHIVIIFCVFLPDIFIRYKAENIYPIFIAEFDSIERSNGEVVTGRITPTNCRHRIITDITAVQLITVSVPYLSKVFYNFFMKIISLSLPDAIKFMQNFTLDIQRIMYLIFTIFATGNYKSICLTPANN